MEDNYNTFTSLHRIAAVAKLPRNDGYVHHRHCEERGSRCLQALRTTTWQSGAFSLIELLISLIISLVVSSFIPIITKKVKHKEIALGSKSITSDCTKFDPLNRCQICDSTSCSLCSTQFNLSEGQYVDPKESCEVKQCPKNCATCDKEKCLKCKKHFILKNGKCEDGLQLCNNTAGFSNTRCGMSKRCPGVLLACVVLRIYKFLRGKVPPCKLSFALLGLLDCHVFKFVICVYHLVS